MSLLDLLDADDQEALAWRRDAACRFEDPAIFFPARGHLATDAKRICAGCPVRVDCLEYALATHQRYGVWSGLSEKELRGLHRQHWASSDALPLVAVFERTGHRRRRCCRKPEGQCRCGWVAARMAALAADWRASQLEVAS